MTSTLTVAFACLLATFASPALAQDPLLAYADPGGASDEPLRLTPGPTSPPVPGSANLTLAPALPNVTRRTEHHLTVSDVQTTTLIFPEDVVAVDRGVPSVLTQTLEAVENVVKVKAEHPQLPLTSLTVITAGGEVYTFRVTYERYPETLTYSLHGLSGSDVAPLRSDADDGADEPRDRRRNPMGLEYATTGVSPAYVSSVGERIAAATKVKPVKRDKANGSRLELNDVWIDGDVIYYRFTVHNESAIAYDLDYWRFYVIDAKVSKKTAVQERDVAPLGTSTTSESNRIGPNASETFVVALPKFTIPDDKRLVLEAFEANGGRHHSIKLKDKHITSAYPVIPSE